MRKQTEHDEQVALFEVFAYHEKEYPELQAAFAIPNGGQRHVAVATKLKAEGVKAGVPDIFIPAPRKGAPGYKDCHGLFVEMKGGRGRGRVSTCQFVMMTNLSKLGYACIVSHGWIAAWEAIKGYLDSSEVGLLS
jgi:hypothetical protein